MKQYLWAGVAVLFIAANASDNPFDLKENFSKLDQDQETLILELQKQADIKEKTVVKKTASVLPVKDQRTVNKIAAKKQKKLIESLDAVVEAKEAVPMPVVPVVEVSKEVQLQQRKERKIQREIRAAEAQKKAIQQKRELKKVQDDEGKKSSLQKEASMREVEEYEKKRKEAYAKNKANKEALVAQEAARAKRLARKAAAKKLEEADAKKAVKAQGFLDKVEEILVSKTANVEVTSVDDINTTREKMQAKTHADKLYEEAVLEMSQED